MGGGGGGVWCVEASTKTYHEKHLGKKYSDVKNKTIMNKRCFFKMIFLQYKALKTNISQMFEERYIVSYKYMTVGLDHG